MSTWFAIHVKPGHEAQAVGLLSATAKDAGLEELFCPMAVFVRREGGELREEELPMIPGCVVAVAPSKWELRRCLRRADGMEALYDGDTSFDAMSEGEAEFIGLFTEPGRRSVGLSQGTVVNGQVSIESGPLAGREEMVSRFSHRRNRAVLEASVAGVPAEAQLGLRVTRKEQRHGSRFSR